jgi:TonB-linked SusC/RagA family outer membrane protein
MVKHYSERSPILCRAFLTVFLIVFSLQEGFCANSLAAHANRMCIESLAQSKDNPSHVVTGKVTDVNGEPLIGVSIREKGVDGGTVTDVNGQYELSVKEMNSTLTFTYVGYKTQEIELNGKGTLDVVMREDAQVVGEVVVTALGIKKQSKALSYNVQEFKTSDIVKVKDANILNSLLGKIAGASINSSAAGAGSETKVVLRGTKSIASNNNALYVLDGIPLPTLSFTTPDVGMSTLYPGVVSGDGMANINSEDIASMTVLNGPSAAALYGAKAANGVIMLTSKTGDKGVSVSYSNNTTFMTPLLTPKLQDTYGAKAGQYTSWGDKLSTPRTWDPTDFYQTGFNTSNNVSLSIGSDKSTTYISAGMYNAEGIIPSNTFRRYNFTATHTTNFLNDKMHLKLLGMYMDVKEKNMFSNGEYGNPMLPAYLMSPSDDLSKYAVYERYDASRKFPVQYWPWGTLDMQMQNPFWIINRNLTIMNKNRYVFGASLTYDILSWLKLSGRVRMDNTYSDSQQKNYASTTGLFAGTNGRYIVNNYDTKQTYGDLMLNFDKSFFNGNLSLTGAIGASIEDYKYKESSNGGDLVAIANLFSLTNTDIAMVNVHKVFHDQYQSLFGTASLGYKSMVFADFSLRNDWASMLAGTKHKSVLYPAVGVSGILTDLFHIQSKVLSFAKVRLSYAEVGNAPLRFITIPTYTVGGGVVETHSYYTSPDFKPERTKSWELGADMYLWNKTLMLNATLYKSQTYNQIFSPQISSSSTYNRLYANAGRIDNKGIELSAELNTKLGPVDWQSRFIYSRNINKIVSMLDGFKMPNGDLITQNTLLAGGASGVEMRLVKGGEMGDIYVNTLKVDEHGFIWVAGGGNSGGNVTPLSVSAERNNYIKAGNVNPRYRMSLGNTFSWKDLSLSFLVSARVGGVGVSLTEASLDYFGVSQRTADDRDNGGVLVNGQRIPVQAYYTTVGGTGSAVGSMYLYKLTNVRLSEIRLGYKLPIHNWVNFVKELRVSVVGSNLLLLYCKAPFDPESVYGASTYSGGIDFFQQPSTRNLGFSVNLTF